METRNDLKISTCGFSREEGRDEVELLEVAVWGVPTRVELREGVERPPDNGASFLLSARDE